MPVVTTETVVQVLKNSDKSDRGVPIDRSDVVTGVTVVIVVPVVRNIQ